MSRLKQNRNIDSLIQSIETIRKSQCSLSEEDVKVLNEALEILVVLKRKKGRTNEQVLTEIVKVVELLSKFFL
ncbi:ABC-type phosphate transport system auxiliary subunit [Saonia flava]|uniref:ABC-type phosphate transport system auxiliary subunit n=1 Tax=Saonia flava TaxID=523696 RepID=A0A846R4J0_9FLAO|nr:ABC-type phosphate transport system auxiliary subunit [Saonia flava]